MTTTQNLSPQEQSLLTNFQELTDADRKLVTAFIQHILDLSLTKRAYGDVLRIYQIEDHAAARPRA